MLAQPFTKEAYDLEEFLDHSFGTLLETEAARSLKAPSGKKRTREPAVRFSLSTAAGKRVRVYPKRVDQRPTAVTGLSASLDDAGDVKEPSAGSVSLAGLDAEEVEAHEAMQEVKRAEAQALLGKEYQGEASDSAGSVLALWSYCPSLEQSQV
jgi:hypothetical protein